MDVVRFQYVHHTKVKTEPNRNNPFLSPARERVISLDSTIRQPASVQVGSFKAKVGGSKVAAHIELRRTYFLDVGPDAELTVAVSTEALCLYIF